MRFRKHEDFALLLMGELTIHPEKRLTLTHIAQTHGVSLLYLKKIVRNLKRAGLVQSKEGITGGYRIARNPQSISVWDVVQAVRVP
jgi:Rrf2 family protein